jgi:hypothetical protein
MIHSHSDLIWLGLAIYSHVGIIKGLEKFLEKYMLGLYNLILMLVMK